MKPLVGVILGCVIAATSPVRADAEADRVGEYVGAGGCASQNCHGSTAGRIDSKTARQDEYATWHSLDRHARSWHMLDERRSLDMARKLGMTEPPSRADRCVVCHAPDGNRRAEGVGCESCHGPAGGWLAQHTQERWEPEQSIPLGMIDTADPAVAAPVCLGCHFGDERRKVDHEMIAAGHPALVFELDTFSVNMPAHWTENGRNERWFHGGAWAVGQAAALRAASAALARDKRASAWPEFSQYDCFTCHHDLSPAGARPLRGIGGRPPLEASRWIGLGPLGSIVDTGRSAMLREQIGRFELLAGAALRGEAVGPAAAAAARSAQSVLALSDRGRIDVRDVDALLRALTAPGEPPGFRTAQQIAWSLAALADARAMLIDPVRNRPPSPPAAQQAAIARLFAGLQNPATYDPSRFAADLAGVRRTLD